MFVFFFLMIRRPPRSTRTDTLFPYTTLFRSDHDGPLAALLHRLQAKHILQVNHGMPQVANSGDPRPAYAGNAQRLIVIMQNFHHRRAGDGEMLPPRTNDQARNDDEGQRHPQYDAQPSRSEENTSELQ